MKMFVLAFVLVTASVSFTAPVASALPPDCPPPDPNEPQPCDPTVYCAGMSLPKDAVRCGRDILGI